MNIDLLIGKHIMGWNESNLKVLSNDVGIALSDNEGKLISEFKPSTNISDALKVLDVICKKNNCRAIIDKNITFSEVTFRTQLGAYINYYGIASTLELAICQAVLASVNIVIDTEYNLDIVL